MRRIAEICAATQESANLAMPTNNAQQGVVSRAAVQLVQSEKTVLRDFVSKACVSLATAIANAPDTAMKPTVSVFLAAKTINARAIVTRRAVSVSLVKSEKIAHKHSIARSPKGAAHRVSEIAIVPVYAPLLVVVCLVQKPTIAWRRFFAVRAASAPSATAEPIVVRAFAKRAFVKKAARTMRSARLVCARQGVVRVAKRPRIALRFDVRMVVAWGLVHATISV